MSQVQPYVPSTLVQATDTEHRTRVLPPREEPSSNDANTVIDIGSTVHLQSWFSLSPWRMTSGWMMFAALLSVGLLTNLAESTGTFPWQTLALLLFLVDPLWGGIWRFAWGREVILPLEGQQVNRRFWLPYLLPGSPAARLVGQGAAAKEIGGAFRTRFGHPATQERDHLSDDLMPLLFRIGIPSLLLAFGIAATLGMTAIWMTGVIVLCGTLGWLSRRTLGRPASVLQTCVVVILPWVLTVLIMGGRTETFLINPLRATYSYWLMGFWALHYWGVYWYQTDQYGAKDVSSGGTTASTEPSLASEPSNYEVAEQRDGISNKFSQAFSQRNLSFLSKPAVLPIIAGDLGMIVMLIYLREPLWLALLGPLWLPTWLAYFQGQPLDRQPFWRLLALLLTAIAIGQTPM
ncbi:MAG: hypothetical protein AAF702_03045 [Chloroflexota bacterium]